MTRSVGRRPARRVRQWLLRRVSSDDGGFILLEAIIAIAVITAVMGAVGAEFVSGLISTSQQRAQQTAVQLADSVMEQIRALHASDLVSGRDSASVTSQFNAAPAVVQPWLTKMDKAIDSKAAVGSGPSAAIPTTSFTQKPGTVAYTINEYLGWCAVRTTGSTDCVAPSSLGSVSATTYLRAVISVGWTGTRCGSSACTYVTSTLISTASDRTFRINSAPYSAPVVVAPGSQSNAVNDTVSLQLNVQNGTGVPPFTWAVASGSLPTGLGLSPTGLISGTVGGSAGTYNFTVQATDAFLRTDTQAVTWTIKPALVLVDPGPQATTTAKTASLALSATGGDGAPYTFANLNNTLPPGLTMTSGGVISGKPTTVGNYTVLMKVTDSSGTRTDTEDFTWTITYPPIAASNPGDQVDTVNTAISPLQLSASGGSGTYAWSDPGGTLPAGVSISSSGLITGAATSNGTQAVTLTVRDTGTNPVGPATVTFNWSIVAKPTVTSPGNSTVSVGTQVSFQLGTTCPDSPCSYALNNGPTGLSITNSGVVTGTVGGAANTYSNVTITVTDADGASSSSAVFVVTVKAMPTVTSPGAQSDTLSGTTSVTLTSTCPNSPCSYALNNGPTGLSVSSAGVISGTVGGTAKTYSTASVTITDASGVAVTSSQFAWVVYAQPTLSGVGAKQIGETSTPSIAISYTCPASPCTIAFAGTLATASSNALGIGLSTSAVNVTANSSRSVSVSGTSGTFYLNGLLSTNAVTSGSSTTYGVSLTITDANSFAPAASTATWTAYSTPTISTPGVVATSQSATPSKTLNYICPTTSCTVSVSGLPSGIGLSSSTPNTVANSTTTKSVSSGSGSVYLNGKVSSTATKTSYQVTVTITYSTTTISSVGTWTVS